MRKAEERTQLLRVFGSKAANARDSERPDFLLNTPESEGSLLGVEVTDLYLNESDAKLKLLSGYTDSLLSGTMSVHRADAKNIEVGELTILKEDGSPVDTVIGIVQKLHSPAEAVNRLFERISEKEEKLSEYLLNCDMVDLVVTDQSDLFHHSSSEQFYNTFQLLLPRKRLITSQFREIHLVTTTEFRQGVRIPLIANAFVSDCRAYEHLLSPEVDAGRPMDDIFCLLAACLWHEGYSRVRVSADDISIGFHCGAWELFYCEDGTKLRDWELPPSCYPGKDLHDVIGTISNELLEHAKDLTVEREGLFSCVDTRLPTYDPPYSHIN